MRIGTEEELCQTYGISRISMRQVSRLLEQGGIAYSRPGRGYGLYSLRPEPVSIVRRIGSYLACIRLSDQDCRMAALAIGSESLRSLIGERDPFLDAYPAISGEAPSSVDSARLVLRNMLGGCPNPIIAIFWRAVAGYSFRAFREDDVASGSIFLRDAMASIADAAKANDATAAVAVFRAMLPHKQPWERLAA